MIRVAVFLALALLLVSAVAASDHQKPLEIANASSGAWDFHNASEQGIRDDAIVWLQICNPTYPRRPIPMLKKDKGVHSA